MFRHFVDVVAGLAGAIYGRRIYEVMRYWDVDPGHRSLVRRSAVRSPKISMIVSGWGLVRVPGLWRRG